MLTKANIFVRQVMYRVIFSHYSKGIQDVTHIQIHLQHISEWQNSEWKSIHSCALHFCKQNLLIQTRRKQQIDSQLIPVEKVMLSLFIFGQCFIVPLRTSALGFKASVDPLHAFLLCSNRRLSVIRTTVLCDHSVTLARFFRTMLNVWFSYYLCLKK